MDNYTKVDVHQYVDMGIKNGTMIPKEAEKFARIVAKQGQVGEKVISWSVDSLGHEIQEKVAYVQNDENTNQPGWIVTKVDEDGNIMLDNNNHVNQWIIEDSVFRKKYEIDPENPTLFKPKGGPQIFVQINDNIILNQWGEDMKIAAGVDISILQILMICMVSQKEILMTLINLLKNKQKDVNVKDNKKNSTNRLCWYKRISLYL